MMKSSFNKTESKILKSLEESVRWAGGKKVSGVKMRRVQIPADLDVRAIRRRLKMSQSEFAQNFGFSASTLKNWEQGTRKPETTARILLAIIDRAPSIVQGVLRQI